MIDVYRIMLRTGRYVSDRRPRRRHRGARCALLAFAFSVPAVLVSGISAETRSHTAPPPIPPAYRQAAPGYPYEFPRDHGAHDSFRTEWWYYTGHLATPDGRPFGFELTFFRRALVPPGTPASPSAWDIGQLYLAHAAVTDVAGKRFLYDEKISRAGLGKAGAESDRLHVWIDRWRTEAQPEAGAPHHLAAATARFSIDLHLTPQHPPAVHGLDGVSRKGAKPHESSHYYSLTRLLTQGRLNLDGVTYQVTGLSWMDHEFGSGDLGEDLVGWDWFSVQLSNQMDVMIYRLRRADGRPDPSSSGTLIGPERHVTPLAADDVLLSALDSWTSSASKARYPNGWELRIPSADLILTIRPLLKEQELITTRSTQVTYWEGAVSVAGHVGSQAVTGQGYVELTGYAHSIRAGP